MQNQKMNLVLSTDAKPRLKWTPELHHIFADAVHQLGGAEKATPKSLMRIMEIPGLTLYHLKSHLQKYRLGKSQQTENCINTKKEAGSREKQNSDGENIVDDGSQSPANESFKIAQALQMQMEVQQKLHEQIEVQRHLQLRIEAQGKYLQSVLMKAQETLSGYTCSSSGVELIKAELSQVMSMVNTGCTSSSFSELTTEAGGLSFKESIETNKIRGTICSLESSLTSSESSGRKNQEKQQPMNENGDLIELPLMDVHPQDKPWNGSRRRSGSTVSDGVSIEQPAAKKFRKSGTFDLNSQYQNDSESD